MTKVTLKTVAERVGVSPMTVSNAFSRPDQLSVALRERILAAATELGYAGPDPAARTLARGATGTVGILLTESLHYAFSDEFSTIFLASIAEELAKSGLALTLLPAAGAGEVIPGRDVAMDGAIIYCCKPGSDGASWLRRRRLPLVNVDQPRESGSSSVNVDDRRGAAAAAAHLVDLGHRRIAVLTVGQATDTVVDPAAWYTSRQRRQGWLDALLPAGIEPTVLTSATSTQEQGAAAVRDLLADDNRPTAVLCYSDALAGGVIRAAEDAGLRVPQDLSVVGFDDTPLAARIRPPLTTVHQDIVGKGRAAAAALAAAVAASRTGGSSRVRHQLLPTELIIRGSTAPPPAASATGRDQNSAPTEISARTQVRTRTQTSAATQISGRSTS